MAKQSYRAPADNVPNPAGAVAVVSFIGSALTLVFAFITVLNGMTPWYVGIFIAIAAITIFSAVLWIAKLSAYRQEDIRDRHYGKWITENIRWIKTVVIPKVQRDSSILLTPEEASQLAYTGKLNKRLGKPYNAGIHHLYFKVDAKNNPIVSIYNILDQYYTEGSGTELIANVPNAQPKKRRWFSRKVG